MSVVSLYTVIQWGMPQLLQLAREHGYRPTLLVTSGTMYQDLLPELFSLAACRAAQNKIMASCAMQFGPQGVNCAIVNIRGHSGEIYPIANAPAVAEQAWKIYSRQESLPQTARSVVD